MAFYRRYELRAVGTGRDTTETYINYRLLVN